MVFNRPVVYFDIETTGLSITDDRIIEFCAIKVDGKSREKLYYKLNPQGTQSSQEAIDKHGITNEELLDKPTFLDVSYDLYAFIEDCDLGGYNIVGFDLPFLTEEFHRAGIPFNHRKHKIIDGLAIFRHYEPRNLEAAYKKYTGKVLENAHSAEADIEATIEVIEAQLKIYDIPDSVEELENITTEKDKMVDLSGKFKLRNGEIVVNFGKHIGKNVKEVYKVDPGYFEWLQGASGFTKETKMITGRILAKLKSNI